MRRAVAAAAMAAIAVAARAVPAGAVDVTMFSAAEIKAAQDDPRKYTLDEDSVKLEQLGPAVNPSDIVPLPPPPSGGPTPGQNPVVVINDIINIAQRLWAIVEANRPVADVSNNYATAMPRGLEHWTQLTGWTPPRGVVYRFTAKNLYGMNMVDVRYSVQRTYGGTFRGKGKYLTAVTVLPLEVNVGSGYRFDLSAQVPDTSVVNVGTEDDPVAAMTPVLTWRVRTVLKDSQGRNMFYVTGAGLFSEVDRRATQGLAGHVTRVADRLEKELESTP